MNQIAFNNAEANRAKLAAVTTLLAEETVAASSNQGVTIDLQGSADVLRTIASSDAYAALSGANYAPLITPLNLKLKTLISDIRVLLESNVVALNNEFAQL